MVSEVKAPGSILALLIGLGALFCSSLPEVWAQIPHRITDSSSADGVPIWVSAEDLALPGGAVRWELLPSRAADDLRRDLSRIPPAVEDPRAEDACPVWIEVSHTFTGDLRPSAAGELLSEFAWVMVGQVTASDAGFFRGTPGTLYEVRIDRALKANAPSRDSLLVFYPLATMALAGKMYCKIPARGHAQPCVGCRIVLALESEPLAKDPIVYPLDNEIYFETKVGSLSSPRSDRLGVGSVDELVAALAAARSALKEEER